MKINCFNTLSLPFLFIWLPSLTAIIASAYPITIRSRLYSHLANFPRIDTYIVFFLSLVCLSLGVVLAHLALRLPKITVRARYILLPRRITYFILIPSYVYLFFAYYPAFISSLSDLSPFEIRNAQLETSSGFAILVIYFNIFTGSVLSGIYFKAQKLLLSALIFICSLLVIYISLQKSLMLLFFVSFFAILVYSPVGLPADSNVISPSQRMRASYWLFGLLVVLCFSSLITTFFLRQQFSSFEIIAGSTDISFSLFTYLGGAALRNLDMIFSVPVLQVCPSGYNLFILKPFLWLLNYRDGYTAVEEVGGINNLSSVYYYYCDAGLPGILLIPLVAAFLGSLSILLALRRFVFFPAASVFLYASILFPFTDMFFDQSLPFYVLLSTFSARFLFYSSIESI